MPVRTWQRFLEKVDTDLREGIVLLGDSPAADRLNQPLELIHAGREES